MPSTPSSELPEPPWRRSRWKSFVVGVAAVLVVVAIVAWAVAVRDADDTTSSIDDSPSSDTPMAGQPAPDFELMTLDGGTVRLSDLRGRPVVVNFWASWCHPCRTEFPLLANALEEHADADLAVVGVTYKDIESDSRDFVDETDASWPQGVDEDGTVARVYGVRAIPQTYFIDRDGRITGRVFGFTSEDALEEPLAEIIG